MEVQRWKVPAFLKKIKSENVDLTDYGTVKQQVDPEQDMVEIERLFKNRRQGENIQSDMTPLHIAVLKGIFNVVSVLFFIL